jgi:hypothetical protein
MHVKRRIYVGVKLKATFSHFYFIANLKHKISLLRQIV